MGLRHRVGRARRRWNRYAAIGRTPELTIGPESPREQIAALQSLLARTGAGGLERSRVYDEATRTAVMQAQHQLGVPETGLADPLTLALVLHRHEERQRRQAEPRRFVLPLPASPSANGRPIRHALMLEAPKQSYVPKLLEKQGLGSYEPATMACFLAALDRAGGGVVFDVGANVGLFALVARSVSDARVVAFEPTPDLAAAVRRNGEVNSLEIQVEELALGRTPGTATFHLSDTSDASNSLNAEFRPSSRSLTVLVDTIDTYCARTGLVPTLLKIDTESTEADVLHGARRVLAEHRPWVLVEVLHGERGADVRSELEGLDYHGHHLADDGVHGGESASHDRNWLFSPIPLDEEFLAAKAAWRAALDVTRIPTSAVES